MAIVPSRLELAEHVFLTCLNWRYLDDLAISLEDHKSVREWQT